MKSSAFKLSDSILADLKTRTILMLSDAYPPYTAGGAEVSLEAVLARLDRETRAKIVICTFSDQVSEPTLSQSLEMSVIHFPVAPNWPYQTMRTIDFNEKKKIFLLGPNNFERLVRGIEVLQSGRRRRAFKVIRHTRASPIGGILTDEFIDERDIRVKDISAVAAGMSQLRLLFCDNTRSILIGGELLKTLKGISSVAVVRDNRFHCERPSQSRIVGGKICKTCTWQCAKEDVRDAVEEQVQSLKNTREIRQDSLRRFQKVIVTSHELERHVAPILFETQSLSRIPNTYGDVGVISKLIDITAQLPKKNLVIIGMLNENKGQLAFLRKAEKWLKTRKDVNLILCGKGDRIEKQINEFAKEKTIDNRVRAIGFRSRASIYEEIRKAHLVLAPTVWPEPFGRVPLEAGIARRAVVAFGVGGLNESITHGYNGYLARPGDYEEFLGYVDLLLDDGDLRLKMQENAFEWVSNQYNIEKVAGLYKDFAFSDV